jgi:hypothetical protein
MHSRQHCRRHNIRTLSEPCRLMENPRLTQAKMSLLQLCIKKLCQRQWQQHMLLHSEVRSDAAPTSCANSFCELRLANSVFYSACFPCEKFTVGNCAQHASEPSLYADASIYNDGHNCFAWVNTKGCIWYSAEEPEECFECNAGAVSNSYITEIPALVEACAPPPPPVIPDTSVHANFWRTAQSCTECRSKCCMG